MKKQALAGTLANGASPRDALSSSASVVMSTLVAPIGHAPSASVQTAISPASPAPPAALAPPLLEPLAEPPLPRATDEPPVPFTLDVEPPELFGDVSLPSDEQAATNRPAEAQRTIVRNITHRNRIWTEADGPSIVLS